MKIFNVWLSVFALVGLTLILPSFVSAANTTSVGELIVEPATLNSLGFEWHISGDDNRNGRVEIQYKKTGETNWKRGIDFHRTKNENTAIDINGYEWTTGNTFAGSVMFLEPDTSYDVKIRMIDPDGSLDTTRELTTRTYRLPTPAANGTTHHVYPQLSGNLIAPAYTSISEAINAAQPGDTVLIHPGTYNYSQAEGIVINNKGTAERTIYVRAERLGEVIINGNGRNTLINMQNAGNMTFENLVFKNAFRVFFASSTLPQQPTGITIHNNIFYMADDGDRNTAIVKTGVYCLHAKCEHFVILNNSFFGPVTPWHPRPPEYGVNFGVQLVGRGHVLGYNYLEDFWDGLGLDGIDPPGYRPPSDPRLRTTSVDFFNNKITEMVDDAIQMDAGVHNIRVYHNYIYNLFMGITAQPIYGGPAYVYKNVIYNYTRQPIKPQMQESGLWLINNTMLGGNGFDAAFGWTNSKILNNLLFIKDGSDRGYIHTGVVSPNLVELDYNGYYNYTLPSGGRRVYWRVPDPSKSTGLSDEWYATLSDFSRVHGFEAHHQIVDYSIFNSVPKPSLNASPLPNGIDFRLKPNTNAIDTGKVIVGLTENYAGSKPDLGAYELGQAIPHYGPKSPSQLPGFSIASTHPDVGPEPSVSPVSTATPTRTPTPTIANTSPSPTISTVPTVTSSSGLITNLVVNDGLGWNIKPAPTVGANIYSDRTFTFGSFPTQLSGSSWIQTAQSSKGSTQDPLATFNLTQSADVYVGIDLARIPGGLPWLSDWTNTGMVIDSPDSDLTLFKKSFPAGPVTLGVQNKGGNTSMYTVFAVATGVADNCPTDIDESGVTDLTDYSMLVANFFKSTEQLTIPRADVDGSGLVDLTDYSVLVAKFGQTCE